ncbi:MAG: co-chaperone GroES [Calditrichaeota bacterium]|nr:co-chaperone GroES [Actinomycetota bacterium]NOY57543.1 co-chaperone GroES [Calditrichota bacterium]
MKKIQPINAYVLIEMDEEAEETTAGGIIIPETAKEKPSEGKVIGIAADASEQIAVGDRVIYKSFSGTNITFDGTDYLLVPASDILAKYVKVDSI